MISVKGGWDRGGHGIVPPAALGGTCETSKEMKTAATVDVTVPANREITVVLPPDVPAGKAKLLVMVEDSVEIEDREFDEVELVKKGGVLVARSTMLRGAPLEAFDHRPIREERFRKLAGR